ncbi:MAG: type II secretion system protein GspD, partial [Bacillota bacterium]
QVQEKIKDVYPDLKTEDDDVNNQIIIEGNKDKVNKALSLAKKMDQEHKLITEIIRIDYIELEQAQNIIEETIPDLTLNMESHNSNLIMVGKEKEVNQGKELIKKLDNPSKQVLLEVQIEEIQRDKLAELGPGFEELRNLSSLDFIKSGEGNLEGVEVDWPRLLRILENRDISQTLANPSLMTSDGEEAKLLIGDQIPYQQTETREDEQVTNYEYMDVGITLEFEPSISKDELILLDVKPQISSIGSRSGNSPLPELKTREVETQISLKDGEGFAIGGLIQDDIVQDISQVPVLSSIPILGRLFRSTKEEDIRTEVIIFITPHIVDPLEDGVKDTGVDKYIEEKTDQKRGSNILERFLRLQEEKMLEDKTGNNAEEKMRLYGIDGKSLNSGDADDYKIQEGEDWILSVPLF